MHRLVYSIMKRFSGDIPITERNMTMKKSTELDTALSDLQTGNQTLLGLLSLLADQFDFICSPIDGKQNTTGADRAMVVYELSRDKNAINSLLYSLRHFINEQDKKLSNIYKLYAQPKKGEQ